MYRVAVVRGGPSEEHDVSMRTGDSVINALKTSDFSVHDVVVSRAGEWLQHGKVWNPIQILQSVDVVFIALHGAYGEDGKIQRYLDTHSIPYTGSKAYASSLAFNKALTKDYLQRHDIKLAPHLYAAKANISDPFKFAEATTEVFDGPFVVKPVTGGSSVGTIMAKNTTELALALEKLFQTYDNLLVEKRIIGKEATIGVINNFREKAIYTLPPVEIVPKTEFFDYQAKYDGTTSEICPGCFSQSEKNTLSNVAALVHDQLGLSQYSRSDFIVAPDGVYFLEVNTLPGLTTESLFPKALSAVGVSYGGFIQHLLLDTLRHVPDSHQKIV